MMLLPTYVHISMALLKFFQVVIKKHAKEA